MASSVSDQQLQAYLDESLPIEAMATIERELRQDDVLRSRLVEIVGRREAGLHGLGEIWRRHRLTCPSRQQLGSYLLGVLQPEVQQYVQFHLDVIGCRLCQANVEDLRAQSSEKQGATHSRRKRYFQSSAGYLGRNRK